MYDTRHESREEHLRLAPSRHALFLTPVLAPPLLLAGADEDDDATDVHIVRGID
ncbi:hypothetical protein [Streptomyces guryensis]|uniref:Uncharacterized protein n=1 Tax=Streptomyces guryensis TaxID=2886947 RepID=A0A9Q3VVS9_9ACTN|nr:hypothetical protein [Streptomyces guryensis]MCD9880878.1 hypothetical protein [Streptomyces guryensis]